MDLREIASYFNKIDFEHDPEALCSPQVSEAYALYNSALDKLLVSKNKEARTDLRKATQLKTDFDDAYILLGLCIFTLGNRIDAMRTFNQIKDPEKHNDAMHYFDKLSEKSGDVVTGYKAQQTYKEPVRTIQSSPASKTEHNISEESRGPIGVGASDVAVSEKDNMFFSMFDEFAEDKNISAKELQQKSAPVSSAQKVTVPVNKASSDRHSGVTPVNTAKPPVNTAKPPVNTAKPPVQKAKPVAQSNNTPRKNAPSSSSGVPRPKRNSQFKLGKSTIRAIIIILCVTILVSAALIIIFSNMDRISVGNNNGGDNAISTNSPEETELITEKATEKTTPTVSPTEVATVSPTEIPEGIRIASANKTFDDVEELFKDKKYFECYKLINDYDGWSYLPTDKAEKLETMRQSSFNSFSNNYYNNMKANVDKDWNKVIEYGTTLLEYNPDYDRGGNETGYVYFHVGKAYDELGDKENARKYYEMTIEKYPDSRCKEWATYRLSLLNR